MTEGTALMVTFQLEGQGFMALNGGPAFMFTPAISLYVDCETQPEVDQMWQKLCSGGEEGQCGWLTDKHGVSWQIVPGSLSDYLSGDDPEGANRAMQAMLQINNTTPAFQFSLP